MKAGLLEEVKHLPVEDRIELAEAIWDTIAEDAGPGELPVPESHRVELDRRLANSFEQRRAQADRERFRQIRNREGGEPPRPDDVA